MTLLESVLLSVATEDIRELRSSGRAAIAGDTLAALTAEETFPTLPVLTVKRPVGLLGWWFPRKETVPLSQIEAITVSTDEGKIRGRHAGSAIDLLLLNAALP